MMNVQRSFTSLPDFTDSVEAAANEPPPAPLGKGLATALRSVGLPNVDGIEQPPQQLRPTGKLGIQDLATASVEDLRNADIPALLAEAKELLGDIDWHALAGANVDNLPIPGWAKEAIKFGLDPEGYIKNKIAELNRKIDDAIPGPVKTALKVIWKIGKGMNAVVDFHKAVGRAVWNNVETMGRLTGQFFGAVGSAVGSALSSVGSAVGGAISAVGGAIAGAGRAVGNAVASAGRAIAGLFGF